MLASALSFSLMSLFVKLAGARLPSQEIVVARSAMSLLLSWAALSRARIPPWGKRKGLLVLRGVFGAAALACFYYALTHLPLALVTVLHYLNPPLAALGAWLFLRERASPLLFLSLLASTAGTLLVTQPAVFFGDQASPAPTLAIAAAIAGACFSAAAYVTVRKLAATESPLVIVFYFPLVALPLSIPMIGTGALWPTPLEWLVLIGVGVTTQLGQIHLTRGLAEEPAGRATAISYAQVVFAMLWGIAFFHEKPDAWTVGGALLVLLGTLLATRQAKSERPAEIAATAAAGGDPRA
jgi:drug/metabolite transporter (DMT)-like permease